MSTEIVPASHIDDFLKWLAPYTSSAPLQREEHIDAYRSRVDERRQRLVRDHYERMRELDPNIMVSEPVFHHIGVKPPTVPMTKEEAIELGFVRGGPIKGESPPSHEPSTAVVDMPVEERDSTVEHLPSTQPPDYSTLDWNDESLSMGDRMRAWMAQKGRQSIMEGFKEESGPSMSLEDFKNRKARP